MGDFYGFGLTFGKIENCNVCIGFIAVSHCVIYVTCRSAVAERIQEQCVGHSAHAA